MAVRPTVTDPEDVGKELMAASPDLLGATRVFLRSPIMIRAHSGSGPLDCVRSASLRTWWISTSVRVAHSSHRLTWSLWISSLRRVPTEAGPRSSRTAFFCLFSGMPPNLATSSLPSARSTVASKHARGPCGVWQMTPYFRAIFVTDERCFAASVLSMEVPMTHCSRLSR